MKKILLTSLLVAVMAMPAAASVQNVKISGNITSTGIHRGDFDLGFGADDLNIEDIEQNLLVTQTTLRVDADLTDNVSATVELINERQWNNDPYTTSNTAGIDLNLAFVTLREMLYSPLTVVIGRQVFSYGNSFIVDATGANTSAPGNSGFADVAGDLTKQSAMDAIRLIFDYNPLTVEVLYSKINQNTVTGTPDHDTDDVDLLGANATYELGDSMDTQVEAYFFARIDRSTNALSATAGNKTDTIYVPGLRASTNPIEGLNIQGEIALQRGTDASSTSTYRADNKQRKALGAQVLTSYQVPVVEEYNPVLQYGFTYVSGDSNPDDKRSNGATTPASSDVNTAWDPLYENQGGGTIYNSLFNLTNLYVHSVSLTANPLEDVTTKVTWTGLWLDKKLDTGSVAATTLSILRPDSGSTYDLGVNKSNTKVGYEIDVDATYDYTEDVQFGASLGWFVPGDLFAAANDSTAKQALVYGSVNF